MKGENNLEDFIVNDISQIKRNSVWYQLALQIAEERREAKSKGERKRYIQLNAKFQRTAQRQEGLLQ